MLSSFLLVLGVAVLAMAFRSFSHPFFQRLSLLCILGTSFLIGYLPSHSWVIGLVVASLWAFLPWLEILTRIRVLRIPVDRPLRQKAPPNGDLFPNLAELTAEIEQEGFESINDVGWDWDEQRQFLRLFHRSSDQSQAAVCMIDQGDIAFYYVSLMTRSVDGQSYMTWNYPFSYALKFVPQTHICRVKPSLSFGEMCEAHRTHLARQGITEQKVLRLDPGQIQELMQRDLSAQITHNVSAGLLTRVDETHVRYTWHGMFYLWFRFLWDVVRL